MDKKTLLIITGESRERANKHLSSLLNKQPSLMHKMSPDYLIYFGVKYHRQCSYFLTQYGMKGDTETATKIENLIDEMPSTLRGDQPC